MNGFQGIAAINDLDETCLIRSSANKAVPNGMKQACSHIWPSSPLTIILPLLAWFLELQSHTWRPPINGIRKKWPTPQVHSHPNFTNSLSIVSSGNPKFSQIMPPPPSCFNILILAIFVANYSPVPNCTCFKFSSWNKNITRFH